MGPRQCLWFRWGLAGANRGDSRRSGSNTAGTCQFRGMHILEAGQNSPAKALIASGRLQGSIVRLIIIVATVISGFVFISLAFFRATRRTYPGFGRWTAGVGFLTVGYLALAVRGFISDSLSIFVGNVAFPLGMVVQLDGLRRFLGLTAISRLWYALPILDLVGVAVLYYLHDSAFLRNALVSIVVSVPNWAMAACIFRHPVERKSIFYPVIGSLVLLAGLVVIARPVAASFLPVWHLLMDSPLQIGLFIALVVLQLGESLSLMALNSERMENQLADSEAELKRTVDRLQESLTERQRIEESLRESEKRYRNFFETSRDSVFMTTLGGRVVDFNDGALELLGYGHSEKEHLLDMPATHFYAEPLERERHTAIVAKTGFSKDYPIDLKRKDGAVIHTLVTTVARKDREGHVIGFQGTIRDITERKHAQDELRRSKEMLSLALEGANLWIWDWDLITGRARWDKGTFKMLGYTSNGLEPTLKNWKRLIHPDDWPRVSENLNLHMKERLPTFEVEYRIRNKSGQWQWVHAQGKVIDFDADGKPMRMMGVVADVDKRKRAEEGLRESEERYRDLVENIDDLICTHDLQGDILFVNRALAKVLGYTTADMIGTNMCGYLIPEVRDKFDEYLATIQREGHANGLMFVKTRSGERRILEYHNTLRTQGVGAPIVRGLGHDITERHNAEKEREALRAQLLQAQKMEAIGTLTGGIAHDFNNLLTIINGFTEMILMGTSQDDQRYADLQKILQTGRKGAKMVQRLLSFTMQVPTRLQPMDLKQRILESKKLMEGTFPKMIEIETRLPDDSGLVNADAGQIDQVIMNLCINAKEAMPQGGRLKIEMRTIAVDEDYCRGNIQAKPGRYVVVEVSDTGASMSKETMARVFDPFYTTKGWDFRKGTGLGLSAAKGIVEQHGGWMTCRSEPGRGTTFSLYLPAIEESPDVREPEALITTPPRGEKILLVDDEEYVRDLGKRILEHSGYTVITAANGKKALEVYAREQSNIALVILDLVMPQMQGKECLEGLLKINPHVKVIVSTGHSLSATEQDHLGTLVKGFVDKPYKMTQLVKVVRDVAAVASPNS